MVNKFLNGVLIVFGIVAILIVAFVAYIYSELNSHSVPPPLYEKDYDGHEERLEQALLKVYKFKGLEISYENGHLGDLNKLNLIDEGAVITYEFWVTYCESVHSWVRYGGHGMCTQSTIALNRIYKDSALIFNRYDDLYYFGIGPYIDLFEEELIRYIDQEIDLIPMYEWVKKYNNDSTEVSVLVKEKSSKGSLIAEHKFRTRKGGIYPQVYTEKYFGDSIVRFDYDNGGHYIDSKKVILADSTIVLHY